MAAKVNPRAVQFNRLVGNRIGRQQPVIRSQPTYDPRFNMPRRIRQIARGAPSIKASTAKNLRGASGGITYSENTPTDIFQNTLNTLTEDYVGNLEEQGAIDRAAEEREPSEDRPWYQDFGHALFGTGDEGEEGGFQGSIVGRALDIASRPAYASFESMQSMAEASRPGMPWFMSPNMYLKEGIPGFIRGLTGEDKTGFGQVYEATKNNPYSFSTSGNNPLEQLEQAHPNIEQVLAVGVGATGELVFDPLNVGMGAFPKIARETGKVATREVLQNLDVRNARTVAEEFATNSPLVAANPLYAANPTLLGDRVAASIAQNFDNSVVDVLGGGNRGTRLLNNTTHPAQVANSTITHIKEAITEPLRRTLGILWRRASSGKMTAASVDGMRRQYSDFDDVWKLLEADVQKTVPTATTDDILDAIMTGKIDEDTIRGYMDQVIKKYDAELAPYFNNALSDAQNMTYRTIGLRFGNKVLPFKAPGRAFSYVGSKLNNKFPNLANRTFGGVFPGRLGLATGRAKALGFKGYDEFMTALEDFTKKHGFTRDESIEIAYKHEAGGRFGDARKDAGLDFLDEWYGRIYDEEVYSGARAASGSGSYRDPNYTYIYLQGGRKPVRQAFVDGRKGAMGKKSILGAGTGYSIAEAKKLGLNPVENAFDNLRYRYLKSMRDRTRAEFLNDMVANYSIYNGKPVRKMSEGTLRRRGLKKIAPGKLNENFRTMLDADPGSEFYIPKKFHEISETFNELSGWSSANGGILMRNWGKVINTLKAWQTLPSTGFHVRNAIGDILMGLMDNINPTAYKWVSTRYALNKAGKQSWFNMVPGMRYDYDTMWDMYRNNADSGFIATEFGEYSSSTAGRIPKKIGRGASTVRNLSDKRELIPRFTHFVESYRQEAQALWDSGIRDLDVIAKRAEDAALFRVNSYKFDYAALLTGEKVVKSLAFPFYTYMRKAAPLLLQQMYTNPKYLSLLSRTMQYNEDSTFADIHKRNFPQLIRDLGFAGLTGGEEPKVLRTNFLPTDALSLMTNLQGSNPLNWGEDIMGRKMWLDILSDLNPLAQVPFERASGRTVFGNQALPESNIDYAFDKIPFLGEFQQEIADIPLLPGGSENSLLDRITGTPPPEGVNRDPLWQDLLSNRLAGAGIPIDTITQEQQSFQQEANRDLYIEGPIKQFNDSNDMYSISVNADMTYNLNNKTTGEAVVENIASLEAILDFGRSQPGAGFQAPQFPGMQPPSIDDVNRMLGVP